MTIKPLDIENEAKCQFVEDLYISAFPPEERRPLRKVYDLYNDSSPYSIELVENEKEQAVGFITHWDFYRFVYVEHFAISGKCRNSGFGQKAMYQFINKIDHRPVVLEVEPANSDMAKRRIGFYQRLGFTLWDQVAYQQPPYIQQGNYLPMYLMSTGNIDVSADSRLIIDTLYQKVYGV